MIFIIQKKINNSELNKGIILEREAHQFLWDLGYLVFPRIKLYAIRHKFSDYGTSIDKLEVTDLDCYGVIFGKLLEKQTFLIDCKHRSENVFSQILRCKGISTLLGINYLLMLRSSVKETVQQFADKFNLRLLSISAFRDKFQKRESGSFSLEVYNKIDDLFSQHDSFSRSILTQYYNCYLEMDIYQRIKALRKLYNHLKLDIESSGRKIKELKQYILLLIFLLTLITLAEISHNTIHLSSYHFKNYLDFKLIGNIEFKLELFSKLRAIENDIEPKSEQFNPLKTLTPSYSIQVKEIVKEFIKNSKIVQTFLRFNDYIIHQYFLLKKEFSDIELKNEFGEIDRSLFGKWNTICLELLDDENSYPIFLIKLLT